MEKIEKLADISANNKVVLERILEPLANAGFVVVYDGENDYTAYICKKVEITYEK